jgi:hypothetical protein
MNLLSFLVLEVNFGFETASKPVKGFLKIVLDSTSFLETRLKPVLVKDSHLLYSEQMTRGTKRDSYV